MLAQIQSPNTTEKSIIKDLPKKWVSSWTIWRFQTKKGQNFAPGISKTTQRTTRALNITHKKGILQFCRQQEKGWRKTWSKNSGLKCRKLCKTQTKRLNFFFYKLHFCVVLLRHDMFTATVEPPRSGPDFKHPSVSPLSRKNALNDSQSFVEKNCMNRRRSETTLISADIFCVLWISVEQRSKRQVSGTALFSADYLWDFRSGWYFHMTSRALLSFPKSS